MILSVSISSVKIISITADNDFSPLKKYTFKRRNLFIKYVSKYKNRLYMYKHNWKDLKELFSRDFWVILKYFETITRWRFHNHNRPYTSFSVFFITHFVLIPAKTLTSKVTTLSLFIYDKTTAKSHNFLPNRLFWMSKQPFTIRSFIASYYVCPVAIPEICAQTQGTDYWQLIHCFRVCICASIRLLLLGTGKKQAWTLC